MQVNEFAKACGVSVRTLHYYDKIGILKPSAVDEYTGYRYYNEESFLRMQEILFYRELDFSLKSIGDILSSQNYDKNKALKEQKVLLTLKKERLERLIEAIDGAMKGENVMNAFDNSEIESYKEEVQKRWGETESYREYIEKTKNYSNTKWDNVVEKMNSIFEAFAVCMKNGETPDSPDAQRLVQTLKDYITENYYNCNNEILQGLGQMYTADERFTKNIDKYGANTATFVNEAIKSYTKQ